MIKRPYVESTIYQEAMKQLTDEEKKSARETAREIINRNRKAFEGLAK